MLHKYGKLFYRNLRMFLLISFIPTLLLGCFSYIIVFRYIQTSSLENAKKSLKQLNQNMELITNNTDALSQIFSISANPSMSLHRILQMPKISYASAVKLSVYCNILDSTVNFNDYIDSVELYFPNEHQRFLASQNGVSDINSFADTSWFSSAVSFSGSDQNFFSSYRKDVNTVTFYEKPFSIDLLGNDGIIIINLDYKYLQELADQLTVYPEQKLYIFNENWDLLYCTDNASTEQLSSLFPLLIRAEEDHGTFTENKNTVFYLSSSDQNFHYVSITPNYNIHFIERYLSIFIIALAVFSLMLSFVLAFHYTKKNYAGINSMIEIINSAKNGKIVSPVSSSNDEYNYIITGLVDSFIKNDYLQVQLSEKAYHTKVLELTMLQSQINPHFLSNTLETIYLRSIALTNSPNVVSNLIENLSDILRYALSDPTSTVLFSNELNYTKCYLNIQMFRYKEKLQVSWDYDPALDKYSVMKLLFQPFIENAIYHGIKEKEGNGKLRIRCYLKSDEIHIQIVDNGKGITREQLTALRNSLHTGNDNYQHIGVINTFRRLELLYGDQLSFSIKSKYLIGTAIWITIPATTLS